MKVQVPRISDFLPANERRVLYAMLFVFLLAFTARLAFFYQRGPVFTFDSGEYVCLAQNIRAHGAFSLDNAAPFSATIRRAPLYPVFLTPFLSSAGLATSAVAFVQATMDSLVAMMVMQLAMFVASFRWAALAGVFYALHPGAIYFPTAILSEPLFTALIVLGTLAVVCGWRKDQLLLSALAGLAFGLATICRPISLPLPFLLVVVSFFGPRVSRRWRHASLLTGCAALVIAPWTARCTRASEQLVIVQSAGPVLFYVATRYDWDQKDEKTLWPRFREESPYGRRLSVSNTPKETADADRYGVRLGFQNVRAAPLAYLKSRLSSFPYLFLSSFDQFTGINSSFITVYKRHDWLPLILKAGLLLLFSLVPFILGVVGVVGSHRNLAGAFCATVWIYTLIINLPMWVEYRYWGPAVPFLLVSAVNGIQLLASRIGRSASSAQPL